MNLRLYYRAALTGLALVPGMVFAQGIFFRAEAQSVPELIKAINGRFGTN